MTILNRDGSPRWGPVRKSSQGFCEDQQAVTTEADHERLQDAYGNFTDYTLLVYVFPVILEP